MGRIWWVYDFGVSVILDFPAGVRARLEAEASRRGVTLDQLIAEIAAEFPADDVVLLVG